MNFEIEDIYGFYYEPFWKSRSFKLTALASLFFLVCLGAFFLWRYLKRRKEDRSPQEVAMMELSRLDPEKFFDSKQGREFYFELTDILKKYIQALKGFDLLDKTDEELFLYLKELKFDEGATKQLEEIFANASFVKFAKREAMLPIMRKDWEESRKFVRVYPSIFKSQNK